MIHEYEFLRFCHVQFEYPWWSHRSINFVSWVGKFEMLTLFIQKILQISVSAICKYYQSYL